MNADTRRTSIADPHAGVRVEWRSHEAAPWQAIGPWFVTRPEADTFAASVAVLGRHTRVRDARPAQLELVPVPESLPPTPLALNELAAVLARHGWQPVRGRTATGPSRRLSSG